MKAVVYCRFSPRRDADTSESIEAQVDIIRTFCTKQDFPLDDKHIFEDRALSGSEEKRPGLWNALEALEKGDVLVVFKLDRLARNVYISHIVEQAVEKASARIMSVAGEGTWNDTVEDELIRRILQALADYQRKVNNARTQAMMKRHQNNGRPMSDRVPYGMMRDMSSEIPKGCKKPGRMVENPEEQEVIRRIVEMCDGGWSLRGICKALEGLNIKCRGRDKWHHGLVKKILERQIHNRG